MADVAIIDQPCHRSWTVSPEDEGCRLVNFIFEKCPSTFSTRSQAKRAGNLGLVQLNGNVLKTGAIRLVAGDVVSVAPPPPPKLPAPSSRLNNISKIRVLHQCETHLVVWKPGGTKLRGRTRPLPSAEDGGRCEPLPEGDGGLEGEMCQRIGKWCAVVPGSALAKAACGMVLFALKPAALLTLGVGDGDDDLDGRDDLIVSGGGDKDKDNLGNQKTNTNSGNGDDIDANINIGGLNLRNDDDCETVHSHSNNAVSNDDLTNSNGDNNNNPDSNGGSCLITIVIVCGQAPSQGTLELAPGCIARYHRTHLTCSNRYGHLSTLEIHAAYIPNQRSLQDKLHRKGLPVANDPCAGRVSRISKSKHGMFMYRVGISVAYGDVNLRLREEEPAAFAAARESEQLHFDMRQQKEEEEGDAVRFGELVMHVPAGAAMRPRKSTETLVSAAFDAAMHLTRGADESNPRQINILDLGVGSGNILLALLSALWRHPHIRAAGVGVDCSEAALDVATSNARRITMERDWRDGECLALQKGTFECPLDPNLESEVLKLGQGSIPSKFDIIVCNPPYLSDRWVAIDGSAKERDPEIAIFASDNGKAAYRQISGSAPALLAEKGVLLLEMAGGDPKGLETIRAMFLGDAKVHRDYKNMERVLELRNIEINE